MPAIRPPEGRLAALAALAAAWGLACSTPQAGPAPAPVPVRARTTPRTSGVDYDVVIVGGGLAGLSAALALRDRSVLLVEREPRLGGRVETESRGGFRYELGALFACPEDALGSRWPVSARIAEAGPVALSFGGRLYTGRDVFESLASFAGADQAARAEIERLRRKPSSLPASAPSWLGDAVQGFFHISNFGPRPEYVAERRADAFREWDIGHRAAGNGELVDALARSINATVATGARAVEVCDERTHVTVEYEEDREVKAVAASAVVVATPATVARKIIEVQGPKAGEFLDAVRYGSAIVVVVCLSRGPLPDFRYAVTPDRRSTIVVRTTGQLPGSAILYTYFVGGKAAAVAALADEELVAVALEELERAGIATLPRDRVAHTAVRRWRESGTIVDEMTYGAFDPGSLWPSSRVRLAGDYAMVDASRCPYGMSAALESGRQAGRDVDELLSSGKLPNR